MLTGIAAGLAAGALWGMVFVLPRMAPEVSPVDLTAGRFVSFGVVAALMMLFTWRRHAWPTPRQAMTVLGFSLLGVTGYYVLLAQAVLWAGTEVPSLIIGTIPLWMMLLGKPAGLKWSALVPGLLMTVLGLGLMTQATLANEQTVPEQGVQFWWGVLLALAAMVSWTAFGVLNAAWLKRHPEVSATEWANWLGVATGFGACVLWVGFGSESNELLSHENIGFIALICVATGLGSAWLASILWNLASRRLSVSLCGQLIVSETLFALFYSFAWDSTWPTNVQWAAVVLFTLGILASIRAHQ